MTALHDYRSLSLLAANLFAQQLTVLGLDPRVATDLDRVLDTDEDGILDVDIEIYAEVEVVSFDPGL